MLMGETSFRRLSILTLITVAMTSGVAFAQDKPAPPSGKLLDRTGIPIAYTDESGVRRYPESHFAHVTGSKLTRGLDQTLNERLSNGEEITLTLDRRIQQICADALSEALGKNSADHLRIDEVHRSGRRKEQLSTAN